MKTNNVNLSYETMDILFQEKKRTSFRKIYERVVDGDLLYVVYALDESDKGFVICSNTYYLPPVIGYSLENKFEAEGILPEGFEIFLSGIDAAAKDNKLNNQSFVSQYAERSNFRLSSESFPGEAPVVSPLLKTQWGQHKPFNNKAPIINGVPTLTGCVATAAAQVMKYYASPVYGKGVIPSYKTTSDNIVIVMPEIDIEGFQYRWEKMTNRYGGGSSEEENEAVADLMLHVGCSVGMEYKPHASNSSYFELAPALIKYFGYDEDIRYSLFYSESTYSMLEKIGMTRNEIFNGRPAMFVGSNHAFIADGLDVNGYFHYNFGFEGKLDGYYDFGASAGYTPGSILTNVRPKEDLSLKLSSQIEGKNLIYPGELLEYKVTVTNESTQRFDGKLSIALCDINGAVIRILETKEIVQSSGNIDYHFNFELPLDLTINKRSICILAEGDDFKYGWKKVHSGSEENNEFLEVDVVRNYNTETLFLKESMPHDIVVTKGKDFNLSAVIENKSQLFEGKFIAVIVDKNYNVLHELGSLDSVVIREGEHKEIQINCSIPDELAAGKNYNLVVLYSSSIELPVNLFNLLHSDESTLNNVTSILVQDQLVYYKDVMLAENYVFPEEFTSRNKLNVDLEIFSKVGLMSFIDICLIDKNDVIKIISTSNPENLIVDKKHLFVRTCSIEWNFPIGDYRVAACIRRLNNALKPEIIGTVDDNIVNVKQVKVNPTLQNLYVRLMKSLEVPKSLQSGEKFDLSIVVQLIRVILDETDNFYGGFTVYLCNGNNVYKIGSIEQIIAIENQDFDYLINCKIPIDIKSGLYDLYVESNDDKYPEFPVALKGKDETVKDCITIEIK